MGSAASASRHVTKQDYDAFAEKFWERIADKDANVVSPENVKSCMRVMRAANFAAVDLVEFQQPINCCNITALAYAFSVLQPSKPVTVNDIFHKARLPGWYVTHDGMTLAETFTAAVDVAAVVGGVFVEAYHFDEELVDYDSFKQMLDADCEVMDDVLIANFSVRIAHQWDHGGGHFALIGSAEEQDGSPDRKVTICEVHPMKYGKTWACSSRHLYDAMVDKDGDAKRARGMIRIGLNSAERRPKFLAAAQKSVCYCDPALPRAESAWLARFTANIPPEKFQMVLNMGGVTASALALTGLVLHGEFSIVEPDDIMRALSLDYLATLRSVSTIAEVEAMVNRFATDAAKVPVKATQVPAGADADAMLKALDEATGPAKDGHDCIALLLTELNIAMGTTLIYVDPNSEAAKLSHFAAHWCLAVRVDTTRRVVTLADPRSKVTTRLWNASIDQLWAGFQAMKSEHFLAVAMKL